MHSSRPPERGPAERGREHDGENNDLLLDTRANLQRWSTRRSMLLVYQRHSNVCMIHENDYVSLAKLSEEGLAFETKFKPLKLSLSCCNVTDGKKTSTHALWNCSTSANGGNSKSPDDQLSSHEGIRRRQSGHLYRERRYSTSKKSTHRLQEHFLCFVKLLTYTIQTVDRNVLTVHANVPWMCCDYHPSQATCGGRIERFAWSHTFHVVLLSVYESLDHVSSAAAAKVTNNLNTSISLMPSNQTSYM